MVALAIVFSACNKEIPDQIVDEGDAGGVKAKEVVSSVKWNGASDIAKAVDVPAVASDRKNASGIKITSNAHSADFPGIYFIWDSKQKDHGYLKVAASVFEVYNGFILTAKMTNEYWDFKITVQPGQELTSDGCYVYYIPKLLEKDSKGKLFNINMVFIGGWDIIATPVIPDHPIIKKDGCIDTYFIMSGATHGTAVVDPSNSWTGENNMYSPHIKAVWSSTIRSKYTTDWDAMMAISFSETIKDKVVTTSPQWVWDRQDSWDTGFSGSNIVKYIVKNFDVELDKIVEDVIPFYFACDNAAVVFVNGQKAAWTTAALDGFYVPEFGEEFTDFSATGFNGEPWMHLYKFDLLPFLRNGANEIIILAANSDENNGRWNVDNNPAGLIYASKFNVSHCPVEQPVIVELNFFGYKKEVEEPTLVYTVNLEYCITWMFVEEAYNRWQNSGGLKPNFFAYPNLKWRVDGPEGFDREELGYSGVCYSILNLGQPGVYLYTYNLYPERPDDPPCIGCEGGVQGEDEE